MQYSLHSDIQSVSQTPHQQQAKQSCLPRHVSCGSGSALSLQCLSHHQEAPWRQELLLQRLRQQPSSPAGSRAARYVCARQLADQWAYSGNKNNWSHHSFVQICTFQHEAADFDIKIKLCGPATPHSVVHHGTAQVTARALAFSSPLPLAFAS